MHKWQQAVLKAQTLPPGHYGHAIAKAMVQDEYEACHRLTRGFRGSCTPQEAARICGLICQALMLPKVKRIVLCSPDVHSTSMAHYCNKEIHFAGEWIALSTLLHELGHHVHRCGGFTGRSNSHGPEYCEALGLCLEAYKDCKIQYELS